MESNPYLSSLGNSNHLHNVWRKALSKWLLALFDSYHLIIHSAKKFGLLFHMVILFGVFDVMGHCMAVDPPVASWSVSDGFRKVGSVLVEVGEDHLKPEVSPAVVANRRWFMYTDLPVNFWRIRKDLAIKSVPKFIYLCQVKHFCEHLFEIFLLCHQQICECIHFYLIVSEKYGFNSTCGTSIAQ